LQAEGRENGFVERSSDSMIDTHTRSGSIRPNGDLAYEHMFSFAPTSKLAQHTLDALRMARSFLLLEDDYDVDWEVDQDELARSQHPHRIALGRGAPLRGRRIARRPGAPAPTCHVCLCPVERRGTLQPRVVLRWEQARGGSASRDDAAGAGERCEAPRTSDAAH
jgi:hypothetical protein